MKRAPNTDEDPTIDGDKTKKQKREEEEEVGEKVNQETGFVHLDEDLLFEVLKHVDARSLAIASCVNKQWNKTAKDERLWEMVCTRHWANIGCGNQQLRSVVLALGGFRRLHSHCLWPLLKPPPSLLHTPSPPVPSSSSSSPSLSSSFSAPIIPPKTPVHWGKDEVQLSLSLLSIRYFEKMNVNNRGR
ncbi:PREDICTED: F-box protein GID2-like [Nelumbo nucifera]|uniref:F-box protein GID2 n=1 Tax=Nelumbo nucifera TaxID=4432 RepID=A0A1U7Z310_NELNU|nr:PREDICTED: F-box protein GID2-like [Nelumbo nucifera]